MASAEILGFIFEILMTICAGLASIFFFLAVLKEKHTRIYGMISGISAIMVFVAMVLGSIFNFQTGTPLHMMIGRYQLLIGIVLLITAAVTFYFALDAKNNVKRTEAYYSTLIIVAVLVVIGVYLTITSAPMVFGEHIISTTDDLLPFFNLMYPYPVGRVVVVIIPLTLYAVGVYALKELKTKSYESEAQQNTEKFQRTMSKLDLEIARKIYHVIVVVVIIAYLFVGRIVMDTIFSFTLKELPIHPSLPTGTEIYDNIINVPGPNNDLLDFRAGHLLLVMAITWIVIILVFTEFIRIKKYRFYPFKELAKVYRDQERLVIAPHVYLTVGIFFSLLFSSGIDLSLGRSTNLSVQIVAISVMVSALADAVATIVGVTKGKHHLKGRASKKTWEGWVAGFIAAILLSLLSYLVLMPKCGGTITQAIVFTLIAASIFGLTDYLTPPISDNILNPILITLTLWGISAIFYL
ncbi:MAG: phosphatidate cytidylyltransferase [Candidatus Helarchaeota archaeon]